jgi:quercetin dioxygenase-like cupin family protein
MPSAKAQPAFERDPVKLDSKHYEVELENERVRVVRIRYGAREKSVMHQHPPGIAVFVTDGSFKFTYPEVRPRIFNQNREIISILPSSGSTFPRT